MKEKELREHAQCSLCRRKIGECGIPIFHRVTVESFVIDVSAVKRQTGLAMMFNGNAALASAMGPDPDMAVSTGAASVLTVCAECHMAKEYPVAALAEFGERDGRLEDDDTLEIPAFLRRQAE